MENTIDLLIFLGAWCALLIVGGHVADRRS
jgi:hypothetical protein